MDSVSYSFGGPVLVMAPMAVIAAALFLYRWRERAKNRRNPLTKALLNAPGASLRAKLKEDEDDLTTLFVAAAAFGAYLGGFVMGRNVPSSAAVAIDVFIAAAAIVLVVVLVYRVIRLFRLVQLQRLGLDGEMATGEELNQLMLGGYRVYHDIPGANYNVDHVVVGQNGVFAIETKTHSKPESGHEAKFDGRVIHYPDRKDFKAVEQAQLNARTLAQHLSKSIGRTIWVHPVVVLPGWCVTQTGKPNGCNVLASGQVKTWLPKIVSNALSSEDVIAVTHQLEQLCRREKPLVLSASDVAKYEQKLTI